MKTLADRVSEALCPKDGPCYGQGEAGDPHYDDCPARTRGPAVLALCLELVKEAAADAYAEGRAERED